MELLRKVLELGADFGAIKVELQAKRERKEAARLRDLLLPPTTPSKSSMGRAAAEKAHNDERVRIKKAAIKYYGLDIYMEGDDSTQWRARTMAGGPELPFEACDMAHIWPSEKAHLADEAAVELGLPVGFYKSPRNYLILPRALHVAFDKEAVLLLPSTGGDIVVRKWRVELLSEREAGEVEQYYGTTLDWPLRRVHGPHLPFMRVMAHKMLCALALPHKPSGVADEELEAWRNNAIDSSDLADNRGELDKAAVKALIRSLVSRLNLG